MLYNTIKRLIDAGRFEGLKEKLDIFFLNNRLSSEEYEELLGLMPTEEDGE